ncbi:hypothetical protein ABVT39_011770 [Epinephelus coioides]
MATIDVAKIKGHHISHARAKYCSNCTSSVGVQLSRCTELMKAHTNRLLISNKGSAPVFLPYLATPAERTRADDLLSYFFLFPFCSDSNQRYRTVVRGRMKMFPGGEVSPAGCQRRNVGSASSQQQRVY